MKKKKIMTTKSPVFPISRPRRLRSSSNLRAMLRETILTPKDFVFPLFVHHGNNYRKEIPSMPGIFQLSIDQLAEEAKEISQLGIPSVILFGIPNEKDPIGKENFAPDGIIQQAIREIKLTVPDLVVMSDVCMCEYTDHGHCGILNMGNDRPRKQLPEDYLLNDPTLEILNKVVLSHAEAGADIVAPSGMIDGMVASIRQALDNHSYENIPILSYAVKYASAYYGPFRDAAESPPTDGDRKSHQMDPANSREALKEAAIDVNEGADMLMVKPALAYLDIIQKVRQAYPELPLAAYNVSGEYAMIKAAAANGWVDEKKIILETLTAIKRAGADLILTYHAKEAAAWLNQ
jgi:porphobilinogen synthase